MPFGIDLAWRAGRQPVPWLPWILPCLLVGLALVALLRRRAELSHLATNLRERALAHRRGSQKARLQHPAIDLGKCIGCGACVHACPEDGVLALAYGQAVVVHGARCVGHGRCADACPTGAIALTLGDLTDRKDLPAVDTQLEAVGVPGLFLAGELTGFALVRTAVQHGVQVGNEVARRVAMAARRADHAPRHPVAVVPGGPRAEPGAGAPDDTSGGDVLDLAIVGLGPAGIACALAARQHGLAFTCLEQQSALGGTVANYPRRKLVMTQPMELPLHGTLKRLAYSKEQLVALWQDLAQEHELPVQLGQEVRSITRAADGTLLVSTPAQTVRARHVCLAVGRRGSPRKLGVPGEDLGKVAYALLDAESYRQRHVLVVGGGDSAVEAALALAEQPGNVVTLSYRKEAFFRLKARNEERVRAAIEAQRLTASFHSEVVRIAEDHVVLREPGPDGRAAERTLPNDDVFVFAGGTPPFPLLEAAGVSFDPARRPAEAVPTDRGTGLLVALVFVFAGALGLAAFGWAHRAYYELPAAARADSPMHELLRSRSGIGLVAGLAAATLFAANLLYLVRRRGLGRFLPGSLRAWMSAHVATGLFAFLCVCLHAGFDVRAAAGGFAFLALCVVVATGVVGRWFYAFVPRAQNGRQADLEELQAQITALAGEWDRESRGFGGEVRARVEALVAAEHWRRGLLARVGGLLLSQWRLRRELGALRARGAAEGVPAAEARQLLAMARRAHRLALQISHFEEVRGLLSSWRWFHRWLALLMVLLTLVHVVTAVRFGGIDWSLSGPGGGR